MQVEAAFLPASGTIPRSTCASGRSRRLRLPASNWLQAQGRFLALCPEVNQSHRPEGANLHHGDHRPIPALSLGRVQNWGFLPRLTGVLAVFPAAVGLGVARDPIAPAWVIDGPKYLHETELPVADHDHDGGHVPGQPLDEADLPDWCAAPGIWSAIFAKWTCSA